MSAPLNSYTLPSLHALCPWPASLNPHYAVAAAESSAWIFSYDIFKYITDQKKQDFFLKRGSELLCAYGYPYAAPEKLRTVCDFVTLLFLVDEVSDVQGGADAQKTVQSVLCALRDESYDDESMLCQMTKDFRKRLLPFAGTETFGRFVEHVASYLHAVGLEAKQREEGVVLDVAAYDILRRENGAVRCCFDLIGYIVELDLPNSVFEHPVFQQMHVAAVDMVGWANDVYSYDMEQSMGHLTNVLTVLQHERDVSLQEAADLVGTHWSQLVAIFEKAKAELPSFGERLDRLVATHIAGMENWVAGNLDWSFATPRYFGADYERVRETLVVHLSTRKNV